jgi:proteasome accessory factor C
MGDLIDVDMDALEGEGVIRVSNVDYLSRPLRLGSSEASALIVALRTLREGSDASVRPVVDGVLGKLEAAAGEAAALAAQVEVQLSPDEAAVGRLRKELTDAAERRHAVRIDYYVPARDESTERTVEPLRVLTAEGHAYLDAWCRLAEDQRLFRLDRIGRAEVLDETFAQRSDVRPRDLADGLFQPSPQDTLVTLLLEPGARWAAEYYPVESVEEAGDGRLRVRLRVGDPGWLTRLMLRLGGAARVEQPGDLAEEVRRAADRALDGYRAGGGE